MNEKEVDKAKGKINSWEIGQVFDEMSEQYTDIMDHMVPHYRKLITSMLGYLPENFKPEQILDLGCGNGNVSGLSLAFFPEAQHRLVDASDVMLRICQERFAGSSNVYEHNIFQDLGLESDKYDLVLAGFSLHHLNAEEKEQFFKKVCFSMTAQGVFACADLFVNKGDEEHEQVLKEWKAFAITSGKTQEDWDWVMDHYAAYDRPNRFSDQYKWLLQAGFARVELSWNDQQWGCFHAYKT